MMATLGSLQLVRLPVVQSRYISSSSVPIRRSRPVQKDHFLGVCGLRLVPDRKTGRRLGQESWCSRLWDHLRVSSEVVPRVNANSLPVTAASSGIPADEQIKKIALLLVHTGSYLLNRTIRLVQLCPPLVPQIAPAFGLMIFTVFGLGPTTRFLRSSVLKRNDRKWDGSRTQNIMSSYMRPILLWIGVTVICRAFDPVVLSTEASQAIKQRFVSFVRSLSTVLAFAFCTASLTQQVQKFMMEHQSSDDARNVGVQFIGNTVYTSVWVAAVCLFMELLGFSTQKWITAGGFGTVLLTLAGREIFTNFLSSIMIHATRPFVESEWIQTKIEGQEVSGTVEHVGWWSPTVIRGDDREAVHIPNHKFSVSVVRNLSQKTHWRIKTHFGISHLDVNKITDIVSDMRKILSKHPQVEQQRLHRRAFFDNIDSENQALLILVSCFVKTSHFEEYLSVKETILLNMLKVISHHNARLATPIRSVQRVMDESETKGGAPFRDMRASTEAQRRPFLLMEADVMADEDNDNNDISSDITRLSAELARATKGATPSTSEGNRSVTATQVRSSEDTLDSKESKAKVKPKENAPVGAEASVAARPSPTTIKAQLDGLDSMGLNPNDITLLGAALKDKPPAKIQEGPVEKQASKTSEGFVAALKDKAPAKVQEGTIDKSVKTPKGSVDSNLQTYVSTTQQQVEKKSTPEQHDASSEVSVSEHVPAKAVDKVPSKKKATVEELVSATKASTSERVLVKATDNVLSTDAAEVGQDDESTQPGGSIITANDDDPWRQPAASHKHDSERLQPRPQSVEDNLVLGVAIDGPKRTLPLDNETEGLGEPRDYVTSGSGNSSKERKEPSTQSISSAAVSNETRDRER